jgi:hypothetical protein
VTGNPLAGRKARVLYRLESGVTVVEVDDPDDSVLVTVCPDGTTYESRLGGLAGLRGAWESGEAVPVPTETAQVSASSVSDGVPAEYAGRPQSKPKPEPESEPEPKKRSWFRDRVTVPTNAQNGAPDDDGSIAPVVELKAPGSPDTERQARIVAKDVWALGAGVAIPMGKLSARHQRPDAVVAPLVEYGTGQGWLVVDAQDRVLRGSTSPIPMTDIGDVDSPAWGPGEPIGTEPDDPVDVWHRLVPGTRTTRIRTS